MAEKKKKNVLPTILAALSLIKILTDYVGGKKQMVDATILVASRELEALVALSEAGVSKTEPVWIIQTVKVTQAMGDLEMISQKGLFSKQAREIWEALHQKVEELLNK